ncbi:MAG: type II toxin-antitoxin system VapC family toxin [Caldilineaceae bacterium]
MTSRKPFQDISRQTAVMLDANVVIYALFPQSAYHQTCKELLERGAQGELPLHLTVSTTADILHRAMVLEFLAQGHVQRSADAVTYLKQHPQAVQQLTRYKNILRDLVRSQITILPLTYRDLHGSRLYREQYGLLTNDSLMLAVMHRERIQYLATNDPDFERVPGIALRWPS